MIVRANIVVGKDGRRGTLNFRMDEFYGGKVTLSLQWNYREARGKENPSSSIHSPRNTKIPSDRRNDHITEQHDYSTRMHNGFRARGAAARNQPSYRRKDSGGDPPRISGTNYSDSLHLDKRRAEGSVRFDKLSNPVMIKKHNDSWRMCVDFKDLNKACPKDGYPLPEIDWKVESLCGYPFKCFLDAYKGYHQIQMAKEDEKRTAFITSQGIFYYSKMPFGLKNTGATYQRLVDKVFQKQIGRNLEVYVDNLVIKSRTEQEIIRDMEETFKTLKEINMKLNPKKCTFGMRECTFLGYNVNAEGLRVCPDKVEAVLNLPSPKCLKDVQKLNGKLASLNRFLSKSTEKSLPFFKTLKKCMKKSDFQWTAEAKTAFKQMKKSIAELPIHALQGPEINYTPMEKLILALILSNPEVSGRLLKWSFELEEHDIHYRPRTSVKGQILADFIVERPEDDPQIRSWRTQKNFRIHGFNATNNEAEYEALIVGLRIAEQMGVKNL
ncbi:reverse transcriptase domain-containing protein [Tanacetum coccineum]